MSYASARRRRPPMAIKETWMRVKDADRLRRRRINKRLSQADLAYLVRRSQQAISQLETGRLKTLSEDLALALAGRLEVDWEDYFELEENEPMPKMTSGVSSIGNAAA